MRQGCEVSSVGEEAMIQLEIGFFEGIKSAWHEAFCADWVRLEGFYDL